MRELENTPLMVYTLRGWIAFVAFTQVGTAMKCFLDGENFLRTQIFTAVETAEHANPAMARLYGLLQITIASILVQCAVCIHHRPLIMLSVWSLVIKIFSDVMELLMFETTAVNFTTLFPILLTTLTLIWLLIIPWFLDPYDNDNEAEELSKASLPPTGITLPSGKKRHLSLGKKRR